MMFVYHHTQGLYEIQYFYKEESNGFTQHINVYNPDIEITEE